MISVSFTGKPVNYAIIDNVVSRSAQPQKADFVWLRKHGVTDVIDFRTKGIPMINFDEQKVVENLGMKYHNIPTYTRHPKEVQINEFLTLVDNISKNNGKVHIHCKAGADRTGMYSFIYKSLKNIGTTAENIQEWLKMGHHRKLYPDLIEWTKDFVKRFK